MQKLSKSFKNVGVIYLLLLVIFLFMMVVSPDYRSVNNLGNIIVQCVPLAVVGLGQTIVMIGGGIDLSVGMTISLSTCIAATTLSNPAPLSLLSGVLAVFGAAFVIGALNGLGTCYLGVPALITTLSMMMVVNGLSLALMPSTGGQVDRAFADIFMSRFGVISVSFLIMLGLFLLLRTFLYKTPSGVGVYALGQNSKIAASMGIRVKKVGLITFIIASLCAGLAGLLLATRMRVGDPLIGSSFGLDSITAAAIGGTALSGGKGYLAGTIAGAFLIGMLSNMMNLLGVNHFYQYVLKGLLLVIAMVVYSLSARIRRGGHEK